VAPYDHFYSTRDPQINNKRTKAKLKGNQDTRNADGVSRTQENEEDRNNKGKIP